MSRSRRKAPTKKSGQSVIVPGVSAQGAGQAGVHSSETAKEEREERKDRREHKSLRFTAVGALISALALLVTTGNMWFQVRTYKAQLQQLRATMNEGLPHFDVSWVSVGLGDSVGDKPNALLTTAEGGKLTVRSPQQSGATADDDSIFDVSSYMHSSRCKCPALQKYFKNNRVRLDLDGFAQWTYLVLRQNGKQAAYDVQMNAHEAPPGTIVYYDLTELYGDDVSVGPLSAEYQKLPLTIFRIDSMLPGDVVAIPLFLTTHFSALTSDGEWYKNNIAVSESYLPVKISFRSASKEQSEDLDIRAPSKHPVFLQPGVATRG